MLSRNHDESTVIFNSFFFFFYGQHEYIVNRLFNHLARETVKFTLSGSFKCEDLLLFFVIIYHCKLIYFWVLC